MAAEHRCSRSCGDSSRDGSGDGTGDHVEGDDGVDGGDDVDESGDDVGEGVGVNSASISNVCRSGSSLSCLATRVVAILHSLDSGGADAGAGAAIGAAARSGGVSFDGGGAGFGRGMVFGCSATRAPGDLYRYLCQRSGFIVDSTANPLLVWPGEGTKR